MNICSNLCKNGIGSMKKNKQDNLAQTEVETPELVNSNEQKTSSHSEILSDPDVQDEMDSLGEGGLCLSCAVCTFPNCGFGKG